MYSSLLASASESLACDLRDVTVTCQAMAKSAGLAIAQRSRVTLASDVPGMSPFAQQMILAHELSHIAQKRRDSRLPKALFRDPTYRHLLEIDAALATVEILAGRRVHSLLPDDLDAASHWGPAGHYWTSLLVMLAAGMELNTALRRAFFCQMPDQVLEFDAIAAAIDDYLPTQHAGSVPVLGQRATPPEDFYNEEVELSPSVSMEVVPGIRYTILPRLAITLPWEASSSSERRAMINRDISSGLHCLTGRRGADEVTFRAANTRQYAQDPIAFGISLHCFGDSYSHQNAAGNMYPPIRGHGLAGHAPDSLHEHQTQYLAYVDALYGIVKSCFGGVERVSLTALRAGLRSISDIEFSGNDEQINATQSGALRQFCIGMGLAPASALNYRPESESISYWRSFHPRHTTIMAPEGQAHVFQLARSLGRLWNTNR